MRADHLLNPFALMMAPSSAVQIIFQALVKIDRSPISLYNLRVSSKVQQSFCIGLEQTEITGIGRFIEK